ncbi:MAG: hypothetical protein Kow0042_01420 [Calditrichia bacterium]
MQAIFLPKEDESRTGNIPEDAGRMKEITETGVEKLTLPENLLSILREKMRLIEAGMGQLLSHLAQGDG